jgi:hypothetical protein
MRWSLSGVSFRIPGFGPLAPRVYLRRQPCCNRRRCACPPDYPAYPFRGRMPHQPMGAPDR